MFKRHDLNPLITPQAVKPSRPDFEVIGAFNAGVTTYEDEVILLIRAAERPLQTDPNHVFSPQIAENGELVIEAIARNDERFNVSDPRKVENRRNGELLLTSISHIRLARSQDGLHFTIDESPWLTPTPPYENFGIEDARVTRIGNTYYVNYSAVSANGICTALLATQDFQHIERMGVILPPANRDVTLFPQQVNGLYVCYHRPMPGMFGRMNIWMATSPDLLHWGNHRLVMETSDDGWESGRVGGGAPPLWTERGWLSIYHAADHRDRYCLGAFLTPLDEPGRIIARSRTPVLTPEMAYEVEGFFPNVVFTCGAILQEGIIRLYYGASDESIGLAEMPVDHLLDSLSLCL